MAVAGQMKLAVIDAHGEAVVAWDDARLAKEIVSKAIAELAVQTNGRRLFARKKDHLALVLAEDHIQKAVQEALQELSLEVARL